VKLFHSVNDLVMDLEKSNIEARTENEHNENETKSDNEKEIGNDSKKDNEKDIYDVVELQSGSSKLSDEFNGSRMNEKEKELLTTELPPLVDVKKMKPLKRKKDMDDPVNIGNYSHPLVVQM
jgi:hypothetical protein